MSPSIAAPPIWSKPTSVVFSDDLKGRKTMRGRVEGSESGALL